MSIWSIAIAAAIFILPSLLSGKKQSGKKTMPAAPSTAIDQDEERSFDFDDVDDEDYSFADNAEELDDLGQPYFSYESENEKPNKAYSPLKGNVEKGFAKPEVATEKEQPMSLTLDGEEFDLRRAIVYQTILQRVNA